MTVENYAEQGGAKWVVGGTLEITGEGRLTLDGVQLNRIDAAMTQVGGVE